MGFQRRIRFKGYTAIPIFLGNSEPKTAEEHKFWNSLKRTVTITLRPVSLSSSPGLYRSTMSSQINIYSQLSISTIRIADINNSNCWYQYLIVDIYNSNCWYQQLELLISAIQIVDINNFNLVCHRLAPKMFVFPAINNEIIWLGFISMRGLELSISTIRIVDIHNCNCRYRQFSAIVDINN